VPAHRLPYTVETALSAGLRPQIGRGDKGMSRTITLGCVPVYLLVASSIPLMLRDSAVSMQHRFQEPDYPFPIGYANFWGNSREWFLAIATTSPLILAAEQFECLLNSNLLSYKGDDTESNSVPGRLGFSLRSLLGLVTFHFLRAYLSPIAGCAGFAISRIPAETSRSNAFYGIFNCIHSRL